MSFDHLLCVVSLAAFPRRETGAALVARAHRACITSRSAVSTLSKRQELRDRKIWRRRKTWDREDGGMMEVNAVRAENIEIIDSFSCRVLANTVLILPWKL